MTEKKTYYAIHELKERTIDDLGRCITDGFSKEDVIDTAQGYYEEQAEENGEYGHGSKEVVLLTGHDDGTCYTERVTLRWTAEEPSDDEYDGGRFDFLAGIGAIRSF